jgi:hypothetical protein
VEVETAHVGIAEEDGAAAVGLESVFVGVDHEGVGPVDGPPGLGRQSRGVLGTGEEREEPGVRGVDVDPDAVASGEGQDLVDGVDGSQSGGAVVTTTVPTPARCAGRPPAH